MERASQSDLFASFQQLGPKLASSYCFVNGAIMALDEIQNMGYDEFALRSKINMPLRLYRYDPNLETQDKETRKEVHYSVQALENNTVFLQTPSAYNDVYDSDVNIDFPEYERLCLIEYCRRCGIETNAELTTLQIGNIFVKVLWDYYTANGNLDKVFVFENNVWNIDKEQILFMLQKEVKKEKADICKLFSCERLQNALDTLPNIIEVTEDGDWEHKYRNAPLRMMQSEVIGVKPIKNRSWKPFLTLFVLIQMQNTCNCHKACSNNHLLRYR